MPKGAPVDVTGILKMDGYDEYILDMDHGAFWTLDISSKAKKHLGARLHVKGKRIGFNRISVEVFEAV